MTFEKKDIKTLSLMAMERLRLNDYDKCLEIIRQMMYLYPESAEPHNLLGLLRRTQGNQVQAMKHFRAAMDLDPTFISARKNMMDGSGPNMQDHSLCLRFNQKD